MPDTSLEQPLEQLLERCLQDLARTGDVEASLRRYPQYVDQLRPLLEMAQATRRYYGTVPQAPGGLRAGRERFLAAAAQQRARNLPAKPEADVPVTRATSGRKIRWAFAMRLVGVLLAIVVGTVVVGGGIAWAASASAPGDLLYPIKTAVEDARLALAAAPEDQVDLALQFADERVEEIQALAEAGRAVPDAAIVRLERHVEQALVQAAWVADEELNGMLDRIVTRLRTQVQTLERNQAQAGSTASQQARVALEQAAAVCRRGAEVAQAGLRDPQAFRLHYRYQRGTPGPADEGWLATATPGVEQRRDQEGPQGGDQEPERTPTSGPHMTPQGPRETPRPRNLPQDPQSQEPAPGTHATPQPQGPTPGHQATPQPQGPTPGPQATPQPQEPAPGPQATPHPQKPAPRPQATRQPRQADPTGSKTPSSGS